MADAILTAVEVSGDRSIAFRVGQEYAADEFGVKARRTAILLAMKRAGLRAEVRRIQVQQAVKYRHQSDYC